MQQPIDVLLRDVTRDPDLPHKPLDPAVELLVRKRWELVQVGEDASRVGANKAVDADGDVVDRYLLERRSCCERRNGAVGKRAVELAERGRTGPVAADSNRLSPIQVCPSPVMIAPTFRHRWATTVESTTTRCSPSSATSEVRATAALSVNLGLGTENAASAYEPDPIC
jgi:hypothetical protein